MKKAVYPVLAFLLLPAHLLLAQSSNSSFAFLKSAYGKSRTGIAAAHDQQKSEALGQYGRALSAVVDDLKKKGDLDGYLLAQTELKRFGEEKKAPEPGTAPAALAQAVADYQAKLTLITLDDAAQTAKLLKQYITALDGLIKKAMMQDNIDEAKTVKEEKDKAALVLADLEATLAAAPPALKPADPPPVPDNKPVSLIDQKAAVKREAREKGKSFQMHRYLLVEDPVTWKEAKAACEAIGGHLVTIGNKSENDFVRSLAAGKSVWLGLTDEGKDGKYRWIDGLAVRFTGWSPGEPNHLNGMERFGSLRQNYGDYGWTDEDGQTPSGFICEWDY